MRMLDNQQSSPYHSVGLSPLIRNFSFMRKTSLMAVLFLAVASVVSAETQTNNVRQLTLDECVQLALANNFDIQIDRFNPRIAEFNYQQLRGVYYDPVFEAVVLHTYNSREGGLNTQTGQPFPSNESESTTFAPGIRGALPSGLTYDFSQNLGDRTGTSSGGPFDFFDATSGVALRQPLLRNFWIDAGRQAIWVAKKDVKISEEAYRQQVMNIVTLVERAYYELIFAREQIKVREKAVELADRLLHENRRRVEVGALAPLDEKQAQSQYARSRSDLITAKQTLLTRENDLKGLISDDYRKLRETIVVPSEKLMAIPETFDLQESWRLGVSRRPELQRLRLELERQDIIVKFRRNQLFPQFDLTGSYGHNGLANDFGGVLEDTRRGDNPSYTVGAVFSIPLSRRGPKNAYNASKAEKEQAVLRYKKQEQDVLVAIENAIGNAQNSLERVKASGEASEYAAAALDAEQKKLESGKSTSFNVLQLQRDLTERRSEEIRALADYNQALVDISLQEATTLDRYHLSVNFK
jgi:outer membrane protein